MDVFKQKRNLVITIVLLVILNIITISLLWIGRPQPNENRPVDGPMGNNPHIQKLLKEKLGFSTEQAEQFITLRVDHKEKTSELSEEIMLLKKEMFEEAMYGEKTNISDSLLSLSLEKQGQLEKLAFEHFLKLKQICTDEQQDKLFKLMHSLLGPAQHEGPPPREFRDGPPLGGFKEGHPPPPPRN